MSVPYVFMVKKRFIHRVLASVLSGMLVLSMAFPASASELTDGQSIVTEAAEAETQAPEIPEPETNSPETQAPETEAVETQAPETEAAETQAPETEATETQAPEAQVPETEQPDTQKVPSEADEQTDIMETQTETGEEQESEPVSETSTGSEPETGTGTEPIPELETEAETETETEELIDAVVREWNLTGQEQLWEVFDEKYRIFPENINSNATLIEGFEPDKAIDDQLDTCWIPDVYKTESTQVYLDVEFGEPQMVKSIVFNSGISGEEISDIPFSVYSSLRETGEDFVKAGDGMFSTSYTWMETVIEQQPFRRLRFAFPLQTDFIPVCSSIRFYSETAEEQVISGLETEDETIAPEETAVMIEAEGSADEADVSTWPLYKQDEEMVAAYDKIYRVYPVGAPTTNMGTYSQAKLEWANDNKHDTFWETGRTNTDTEKAWLDFTFTDTVNISRVVYGCRLAGYSKGFATEFEIYASQTDSGENFEKVAHGFASRTADMIQIDFPEHAFKRLRFKYIHSDQEYPSCREMLFYKEDKTEADMDELFTDYRMYEINKKYSTLDSLYAFQAQMLENPKYELSYKLLFERAEKILKGELKYNPDLEVFTEKISGRKFIQQNGDVANYAHNTLKFSTAVTNRQVVGISALSGDTITVYVDGKKGDKLPSIVFSQAYGYWSSWLKNTTQLHLGVNEITVPEFKVANANYSTKDIPSGGPIYVINPYTSGQQSSEVKLYFENCDTYPYFMSGGDVTAYKKALSAQADRARENPTKYFDVTELVSNHVIHTVTATLADEMYDTLDPQANLNGWDEIIRAMLAFDGVQFDPHGDHYDPMNEHLNQNFRVSQNWDGGFMFTASEHIGLYAGGNGEDKLIYCLDSNGRPSLGWGFVHEYGHAIELGERAVVETTNNMPANMVNTYYNKEIRNENYFDIAHSLASDRDKTHGYENGAFNSNRYNYIIYFILESYYNGYWGDTDNLYRYGSAGNLKGVEKQIYLSSLATGIDLGYYFERWGYSINEGDKPFTVSEASEEYRTLMGQALSANKVKAEQIPFWYIDSAEYTWMREHGGLESAMEQRLYDGKEKPVIEKVVKTSSGRSIRIKGGHDKDDAHLGYEILEGDGSEGHKKQVIGFTYSSSYTDSNSYEDGYEPEYTVIAYDRLLQKSAESDPASSEAAADGVCEYNSTVYPSIGKALEAAEPGSTIYLLKDIYDCGIEVTKSVTITPKDRDVIVGRVGADPLFTVKGSGVTLSIVGSEEHSLTLDGLGIKASNAMLCAKESATLNLSHVKVMESASSDNGGAVTCLVPAKSAMDTVIFENNRSDKGGGALYNTGNTSLKNCTFTGNTAVTEGGAIDNNNGGVITLTGCTLAGNRATTGGGYYANGHTTMTDVDINGNAAARGGAIGFASANGARTLTVKGGTDLSGNTADDGSTVYLHSNAIAEFQDVVWKEAAAAMADGDHDIVVDSGKLTMDGSQIETPVSLYKNNGSITIKNRMPEKGLFALDLARYTTSEPLVVTNFDTSPEDTGKVTLSGGYGIIEGEDGRSLYLASDNNVTLHANGGTVNTGNVTGYITGTYVVLPTDVTLEGRTFGGWYDNEELKGTSVRSIKKTDTGDKEYWAKWNITRYKISYNTNGGSIREVYTSFYYDTDSFTLPQNVEKANPADKATVGKYSFEGWYDNKEFEGDPVTEVKKGTARNLTVYAKWSHLAKPAVKENPEPASCTTGSSYEVVSYCVDCGEEMSRERVYDDDVLGHTFGDWIETSAPDCDDAGVRSHSCEVCGYTETDGVSATGHDWEVEATIDRQPTCTTDGSSSVHCRKCNATKDNKVIPMLEHTPGEHVHENEVPATCTTDGGYDDVVRCTVCGAQISSTHIPTAAYGHNWSPWETIENATCHSDGAMKRICLECGFTQMKETTMASHEWESEPRVDVEPACTTEGSKSIHCRNCDAQKSAEVIPATGHKGGAPVYENEIPATCTTDGSHTEAIYCEVCHQLVSKEEKTVPAHGHSFGGWQTLDMPDCDDAGTQIRYCSVCGVSETNGLSAAGHDWDAVYTVDKEPTCMDAGSKSIHCKKCGATEYAQEIPALGHTPGTPVHENEIAPGCDTPGSYNEVVYCSVCHTVISRQTMITEAAGHQFGDWKDLESPDCNDSGARERSCKVCGLTETDNVNPNGHDWLEDFIVDKEPTCTEEGSESIHCRNCDAVKDAVVLHAKGHTAGEAAEENRIEASCTEDGSYDSIIRCVDCGELIFHDKVAIDAKGHQFENGVCSVCGAKEPERKEVQTEPEKQMEPETRTESEMQTESKTAETDRQTETGIQTEAVSQSGTIAQTETEHKKKAGKNRKKEQEDETTVETDAEQTETGSESETQPETVSETEVAAQTADNTPFLQTYLLLMVSFVAFVFLSCNKGHKA